MVERRPKRRCNRVAPESHIDWYLWRPCTGVEGVVPPMCTKRELQDGTYSLADVEEMNQVIADMVEKKIASMQMQNAP